MLILRRKCYDLIPPQNYEYIAPFYFERNAANNGIVDTGDAPGHDILALVYK